MRGGEPRCGRAHGDPGLGAMLSEKPSPLFSRWDTERGCVQPWEEGDMGGSGQVPTLVALGVPLCSPWLSSWGDMPG